MILKQTLSALVVLSLSTSVVTAAPKTVAQPQFDYSVLSIQDNWATADKAPATPASKRKIASLQTFSESDLSADFKKLRAEWLKVQDPDQLEGLLKKSYANFDSYSDDTKYFLTQAHVALPLRGIVWRLRPLFEKGNSFLGNKATHVSAIQILRSVAGTIDMALPTDQAKATFRYFTEPSADMSNASQFKSIAEFQSFLGNEMAKKLYESTTRIEALIAKDSSKIFVWDNKMLFGTGAFRDDIQRYSGHGAAEMHLAASAYYRSLHGILVFCAYNQDLALDVAKKMGAHVGQDSISILGKEKEDLGLTDEERVGVMTEFTKKKFLSLRDMPNNPYGTNMMKQAYTALKNYVLHAKKAYELLQDKDANPAMALNPIHFSSESQAQLGKGISNMVAVVKGEAEVRDPVSGKSVTVNLPAFYNNPPQNLGVLMANKFEQGANEKTIKAKNGDLLKVRNYDKGRSIGWNNDAWKTFVPSAAGQSSDYMAEARRIMRYSRGTSLVMNLPTLFVR
ncbi:hypothetical protein SHI21_12305 [Bacteriovorax sp. PP10]|uniref:Uncharacterized protein n=1 Tax=Bacteriovorax antarcticus TaxID=3088717 RepID=A0ABU5VVB3_9BACT|nr:hypothetical protein [Bacteriovorax sp. PP10]MEA9356998.1 hypothetical protein [Bacteriovorax sp. PP10]